MKCIKERSLKPGRISPARLFLFTLALLLLLVSHLEAQTSQKLPSQSLPLRPWVVRPEWVRAHEDFLASDALAGRGSATRDEQIAAEYVASEFLAYGLKPPPGMSRMIQTAEVVAPELDGKSVFTVAGLTLPEGPDLRVFLSPGTAASGPLIRLSYADALDAKLPKGAVVLLPHQLASYTAAMQLRDSGAAVILFEEDQALRSFLAKNPHPQIPLRLKDDPEPQQTTLVALSRSAITELLALKEGEIATLAVHPLPLKPRHTSNALGYLEGTDPAAGTLLLSAHLDHLGVVSKPVNGDAIYNGANDDASGTTAVLELAHALVAGPRPRRSILFVCYGSEEAGELGSMFFARHPPVPLVQIVADLELEMLGDQDPKLPRNTLLFTGWERSDLAPNLHLHGAQIAPDPYPDQHFFERSDNFQLALQGVVAHTIAGWPIPPTYHQPSDDLAHLNFDFLTSAIQSLLEPVRWLANNDFRPAWNADGEPRR